MPEDNYDAIRKRMAAVLRREAALHKLGQLEKLGADFLDIQSQLRYGGDERYRKLVVALYFWDAWLLARNTDWMEHSELDEEAWPPLAESIAADLDANRDITSQEVVEAFDLTSTLPQPRHFGPRGRGSHRR